MEYDVFVKVTLDGTIKVVAPSFNEASEQVEAKKATEIAKSLLSRSGSLNDHDKKVYGVVEA